MRNLEFSLTIDNVLKCWQIQDGKCALSGIEITLPIRVNDRKQTSSIDRIDSNKGYILRNIQWVHKDINYMKNCYSENYFFEICKQVANFQEEKRLDILCAKYF
jgi:hypothetical protein